MNPSVLVLAGATASGKTTLGVELAREFDAEIVGADSRQIYRDMPIGTAAPSRDQQTAVPHHLVGFLDPRERYSAALYAAQAVAAIGDIHRRGKRAIVCGGTGFYIRALTGGVSLAPQYDPALRERLAGEARLHESQFLYDWLASRAPRRAAALAPSDPYRVLRALEITLAKTQHAESGRQTLRTERITYAFVVLDVAQADLNERIAERADRMLAEGFVEEAERVGPGAVAANAVGYPYALTYLRGWNTRAELRALLVRATRRYARRQRTWFRGEREAIWVRSGDVRAVVREKLGWLANE
jgi:tRNA dimethylallyltransferase